MNKRVLSCVAALLALSTLGMAQKVKSQKEFDAWMAVQNEPDPDQRIKKVDEFLAKYADTELKPYALQAAADAAQRKGDSVKAIVYAQSALDADPKSYRAMLLISGELARTTRENDLDKEEKLARAEKLAKDAIVTSNAAPKPNPQITDDQWTAAKKDFVSMGHEDLGLVAMARKKMDVAIAELKLAIDSASSPDPTTMVRLAGVYNQAGKPDDALALANQVLAMQGIQPVVKQFATTEKNKAEQAKNAKK